MNVQGIKTAISIVDGLSPSLKNMNTGLNSVINNFHELHHTTNAPITNISINNLTSAQRNLNETVRESGGLFDNLKSKVLGLVGAYASMQGASALIKQADELTSIKSRLDLMNDGLQTTDELQAKIMATANATSSSFKDTADMIGKLGIQAGESFANNDELIGFAEQINKHLTISGTSGSASQGAMIQLTQAMSNGVLRGEELNSVLDGMPTVIKSIREEFARMGDTRGIKEIAEEGKITADIVKRALFNSSDKINKQFEGMGTKFNNIWVLFNNYMIDAMQPVYDALSRLSNNKALISFAKTTATLIGQVATTILNVLNMIGTLGGYIASIWHPLSSVIIGVLTPLALYKSYVIGAWLWTKIMAGASMIWTGISTAIGLAKLAVLSFTNATKAGTIATLMFNKAWLANPITWILIGIGAILGTVIGLVFYFSDSWQEATGKIIGALTVVGSTIYNVFAGVWNFILYVIKGIITPIVKVGEIIYNAFNGGFTGWINAFKISFYNTLNFLYEKIKPLIELYDKLNGSDFANTIQKEINAKLETEKGDNYKTFDVNEFIDKASLDFTDPLANYKHGKKFGETMANTVTKKLDNFVNPTITTPKTPKLSEIANNTKATADNTKQGKDELRYILDIAEREQINRFTTAEIKIEMQNNNNISNDLDIDGVINTLTNKLYQSMSVASEGVHY